MIVQALAPTTPVPSAPTGSRPMAAATPGTTARPASTDTVNRSTISGSAPASMTFAQAPASHAPAIDFTKVFEGFSVGGQVKINCSIPLAGGRGILKTLDPEHFVISGHVSIAGLVNKDLDVDLHKEADGTFRMSGTCDLHVTVTQSGNALTITDLDSPSHHVYIQTTKSGDIAVKTTGMGFDKIGAHVRAK